MRYVEQKYTLDLFTRVNMRVDILRKFLSFQEENRKLLACSITRVLFQLTVLSRKSAKSSLLARYIQQRISAMNIFHRRLREPLFAAISVVTYIIFFSYNISYLYFIYTFTHIIFIFLFVSFRFYYILFIYFYSYLFVIYFIFSSAQFSYVLFTFIDESIGMRGIVTPSKFFQIIASAIEIFHHIHHYINACDREKDDTIPSLPEERNPIFFMYPICMVTSLFLAIFWLVKKILSDRPMIVSLSSKMLKRILKIESTIAFHLQCIFILYNTNLVIYSNKITI